MIADERPVGQVEPDAIARLRLSAYQKSVVMKYLDNLLDWGDSCVSNPLLTLTVPAPVTRSQAMPAAASSGNR